MIDLTQFTPWTLFTDLGFISILLLVGKFIRVKVKLIQQLFIPPSLIAGLLGLAFGPNGLGWIPLSNKTGEKGKMPEFEIETIMSGNKS